MAGNNQEASIVAAIATDNIERVSNYLQSGELEVNAYVSL